MWVWRQVFAPWGCLVTLALFHEVRDGQNTFAMLEIPNISLRGCNTDLVNGAALNTLTNPPPCLQFFTFDRNGLVRAETPPIPRHAGAAVQHKSEKNLYEPERFRERSVDPGSSTSDTPICTPCPFSFPPPIFFRS